jgi:hypothetical protein
MGTWDRWMRAGKRLLHGEEPQAPPAPTAAARPDTAAPTGTPEENAKRGLSGWVEDRAQRVVQQAYQSHAEDLEERALRVMNSVYERTADDMEERAVRAMRRSIEAEAERIKEAIEHGIAVKKREVRLSLLVLVVSSLIYLALYWFTSRPDAP